MVEERWKPTLGLDVSMSDALRVAKIDGAHELDEVEVGDILRDADVGLDLVEQIAAVGVLHGDPLPDGIFAPIEEADDVDVAGDMLVQPDLEVDLRELDLAELDRAFLVDELDCDDEVGPLEPDRLSDAAGRARQEHVSASVVRRTLGPPCLFRSEATNDAYDPRPMVSEMRRKGSLMRVTSNCDCCCSSNCVASRPVSGVAFRSRQNRLQHVSRHNSP